MNSFVRFYDVYYRLNGNYRSMRVLAANTNDARKAVEDAEGDEVIVDECFNVSEPSS
jgi:hypothetical protein